MTEMKIKTWIIDKAQDDARRYNIFFDVTRRTNDDINQRLIEDGCYYMKVEEVLKETEKAIQIKLSSGDVIGSYKGWTLWVPKSQIM